MEIHWNKVSHLSAFVNLNNHWIEKYFQLEEMDTVLSKDPAMIIRDGGHILSITDANQVIGVCALFKKNNDIYELARMAVLETKQGQGIGKRLLQELIDFSEEQNAKKLILVSNTKLTAAIHLYRTFGFQPVFKGQHPEYNRGNIIMEKTLNV